MRDVALPSILALTLVSAPACGASSSSSKPAEPVPGLSSVSSHAVTSYSFESLDARPVSSLAFEGKPVVLAFITTWDLLSQAQMRFFAEMDKRDAGKVAYVAVCLQEAKDRELIEVYRSTLGVTFPLAIADRGTIAGSGPFGEVQTVPTVVVLDGAGHVRFQKVGLAKTEEIRAALKGL